MMTINSFRGSEKGASAAEFAMVLPIFLLFLLGTIDAGRYIWNINEVEKSLQTGARWAIATDMVCSGLQDWSFATDDPAAVAQGTPVPRNVFNGVDYPGGDAANCVCPPGASCNFPMTANTDAYEALVARMDDIYPDLAAENVSVEYDYSGLGYSGDPHAPDVSPIVTVRARGLGFRPIFLGTIFDAGLPDLSYSLTMEDGQGSFAN